MTLNSSRLFRRVEERNPTYELSHGRSILGLPLRKQLGKFFGCFAPTGDCCGAACIFVKPFLKRPSSVSFRSPPLPSARKQPPEKLSVCRAACDFQAAVHVYFVGLKNATRPTNSFLSTFPWGKVPVGRMRDLHDPHQSRCARQLCLRHASSPRGS